jgi:hypothetical protein
VQIHLLAHRACSEWGVRGNVCERVRECGVCGVGGGCPRRGNRVGHCARKRRTSPAREGSIAEV